MADIRANVGGIKSPNPFWLASGPPTNCQRQIERAFDAGWGGAVWKTVGEPIVNVNSRYGALDYKGAKIIGFNNIELITDRSLEDNLKEVRAVKKKYPHHAVIVSMMVETKRETWHEYVKQVNGTGADGIELNFGCPHGMSERGMGAAVGQVPEYTCQITEWVKEVAEIPVLVKLTPNITDITKAGLAAQNGGADGVSLINTINSITGVDLDTLVPRPDVGGYSAHGGYCGPAVKPIALNMVSSLAAHPGFHIPISGIGGIETWKDAAEYILLGASGVQVCTAAMHYGFRIVNDMIEGLTKWMDEKGFATLEDFRGKSAAKTRNWGNLPLTFRTIAHIDPAKCIGCQLCYIACEDGAHQAIGLPNGKQAHGANGKDGHANPRMPVILEEKCVGCNLCSLVCPVDDCITMVPRKTAGKSMSWNDYLKAGLQPVGSYPRHDG